MAVVEKRMYVKTDASQNNNKFWAVAIMDNGDVECSWGRVGTAGQSKIFPQAGRGFMDKKAYSKESEGYRFVPLVNTVSVDSSTAIVQTAAKEQIASGCKEVESLVEMLTIANKHEIMEASGGQITVDLDSGMISTPVGVVTKQNIWQARTALANLEKCVVTNKCDDYTFMSHLNSYLMLVPQVVGRSRGWHKEFLPSLDAVSKQYALLDQLDTSIALAEDKIQQIQKAKIGDIPKLFDVSLKLVEDGKVMDKIIRQFKDTSNSMHVSRGLKPVKAYTVDIASMVEAFAKDGKVVGGIKNLWHGTRTYNVLSILKKGLIIPKEGGSIPITGRMFGNGLYFSDQSTKALNYSYGYWSGQRESHCFMFLADVAMGKAYTPAGPQQRIPAGYDSMYAKAGKSGVHNNEMIVYRTSQANLNYLVEFK